MSQTAAGLLTIDKGPFMRKTINISVSEEMYEHIRREASKKYYGSVSEYFRSLVRRYDEEAIERRRTWPMPRRVNDIFEELEKREAEGDFSHVENV